MGNVTPCDFWRPWKGQEYLCGNCGQPKVDHGKNAPCQRQQDQVVADPLEDCELCSQSGEATQRAKDSHEADRWDEEL